MTHFFPGLMIESTMQYTQRIIIRCWLGDQTTVGVGAKTNNSKKINLSTFVFQKPDTVRQI